MRQRTVNHVADTIFWYLIYFLPVIAYLLFILAEPSTGTTAVDMISFFNNVGFTFNDTNIIFSTLTSIFGSGGVLPLFTTNTVIYILTWFVSVFLCHLLVDFVLFIPRLCHKFMKKFTQGD